MYSRSKPEGAWAQRWHQHWVGAGTIKFTQPSRHRGLQMCVWVCVYARALLSNRKWDAEMWETLKATSWFLINTSYESFTFACNTKKKKKKSLRRSRLFHEVWRAWKLKLFRVVSSSFSSSSNSPMVSIIIIFFCLLHSLITFWGGKGSFGILEIKPS